eukprot:COSAG06_NODE_24291_length_667_cov_0.718310_1_plen_156_part_10
MTSVFKTQKVPFHIHSSHDGLTISDDLSTLTVPLDPPLTLPSKYKATAQMYNLSAVNSMKNVSEALGNNVFTIVDNAHPTFATLASTKVYFQYYGGTYADYIGAFPRVPPTVGFVNVAKGDTLADIQGAINSNMSPDCEITLGLDLVGDQHVVVLN